MSPAAERGPDQAAGLGAPRYEPPRVERALGPTELDREILYAGGDFSGDAG